MRALVTGANGFVGSRLVKALLSRGHQVTGLVRRTSDLRFLEGLQVHLAYGDLVHPPSLVEPVRDAEIIYHLAAVTKAKRPKPFYQVNHQGTVNLLEACFQHNPGVKKFLLMSTMAAVGPGPEGCLLQETDLCQPISDYGHSKVMAEEAARVYQDRLPITVVRPPAVYGPGDSNLLAYFKLLKKRLRLLPGWRDQQLSICHIDDLVRGTILAGESDSAVGKTYFISGEQICSWDELTLAIASAMGVRALKIRVPIFVVHLVALIAELFSPFSREGPLLNRQKARELSKPCWACDWGKARDELGYRPLISLEGGLQETVSWYREQGWL
jgi:nucleoside-diphosphate-sugar epimerase